MFQMLLLTVAGFQVPAIPLLEVEGKVGTVELQHLVLRQR
jgi:hypothetical protein